MTKPPLAGNILIALSSAADSNLLVEFFATRTKWTARSISQPAEITHADLLILDAEHARIWRNRLLEMREALAPVMLGVLLVSPRNGADLVDEQFWMLADDLIHMPVAPRELLARVTVLLRARSLSMRLQSNYLDQVEHDLNRYRILSNLVADGAYSGHLDYKANPVIDWVSARLCTLLGLNLEQFSAEGGLVPRLSAPEARLLQLQYSAAARGCPSHERFTLQLGPQGLRVEHSVMALRSPAEAVVTIYGVLRDISLEDANAQRAFQLGQIIENTDDALIVVGADRVIRYVNHATEQMTGLARNRCERAPLADWLILCGLHDRLAEPIVRVRRGEVSRLLFEHGTEGTKRWLECQIQMLGEPGPAKADLLVTLRDVTHREHQLAAVHHLSNHDPLTQLPNRNRIQERLQAALEWRSPHGLVGLLLLKLTNLKTINESAGHLVGDVILAGVTARLRGALHQDNTLGRIGGSEFAVVLPHNASVESVLATSQALLAALEQPIAHEDALYPLDVNIGIAISPDDGLESMELMQKAESAVNNAGTLGTRQSVFFKEGMNRNAVARLRLESELRYAIANGELVLHYQPKLDRRNPQRCKLEALLRWQHPSRGLVSPAEFIPVLESSGLIVAAGRQIQAMACAQVVALRAQGLDVEIAVNVSAREFAHPGFCDEFLAIVGTAGVSPQSIEIEITESLAMQNPDTTLAILARLHSAGFSLAIDDFGTGYSSLVYLSRFPVDVLKIDRAFIDPLPGTPRDAELVKGMIGLAHSMNIRVVAEGVETPAQADFLDQHGCDYQQGFLHARPTPPDKLVLVLQALQALAPVQAKAPPPPLSP